MNSPLQKNNAQQASGNPYRVMVVDDSAIIRGFICRYLQEDPQIEVVTTAINGEVALKALEKYDIEVVVLDIEMPVMDGLTALPKMIQKDKDLQVVMASTLTLKNAEVSLTALGKGAVDYVPKPETTRAVNASIDFRREIVEKVKAWGSVRRKTLGQPQPTADKKTDSSAARFARPAGKPSDDSQSGSSFVTARRPAAVVTSSPRPLNAKSTKEVVDRTKPITLRKGSSLIPKILAVGSSTGGPQALMAFFKALDGKVNVPIVVVQHMPKTFTAILAQHITSATNFTAGEGKEGDVLKPGHIYVAPGDYHMACEDKNGQVVVRVNQDPQENYCRPSVDPLFRSLTSIFKDRVLAVILTGMGHDGLKGSRDLVREGATILAQDEASSVVWGMPGAVATAGLCSEVLPLEKLGDAVARRLAGGFA